VLQGAGADRGVQRLQRHAGHGLLLLRVHDAGDEAQVVGDRVAFGQLAQAGGALGNRVAASGRRTRAEAGAVQGFDVAGLKNALQEQECCKKQAPAHRGGRRHGAASAGGEGSAPQLLSPVILRYQPRWCCLAQARVTVP
jgi:hypothetical protein